MKKKNLMKTASLAVALLAMGLSSCGNDEPVAFDKNEASGVEGFVTFDQVSDGEVDKNLAASGVTVRIAYSYDVQVNGEAVEVKTVETTQTDKNGWYSFKLNVPVAGSADYTLSVSFIESNDEKNGNGEDVTDAKCLFFVSKDGSVAYGSTSIENLKAVKKGMVDKDYANN